MASSLPTDCLSQRGTNNSSVHRYDPFPPSVCFSRRLRRRIDDDNDDFGTCHIIHQRSNHFANVGEDAEDDALDTSRQHCHLRRNDIDNDGKEKYYSGQLVSIPASMTMTLLSSVRTLLPRQSLRAVDKRRASLHYHHTMIE